jgi:kynurenine formamidase
MKQIGLAFALSTLLFSTLAVNAQTPSWLPPPDNERCPSKWGAGDERGAANHVKPQSVLNALKLVKTGEMIELAHVLNANMPFSGTRRFDVHVKVPSPVPGANNRVSNEEMVLSEIGQVGTQFDGFAHQSHAGSHYNCFKTSEIVTRTGFNKLGIQNVGTLISRGVLIDVAGYKGVPMLGDNYEITVEDIEGAVKKQNITFQSGDAILIHTGWSKLWGKENARYSATCPGLGVKAAQWLIAKDPLLLGADNWPVEVGPNPDKSLNLPVHQLALVVHGVHLLENLKLDEMVAKNVTEFVLVLQPMKMQGTTGSTVAPIALR